MKRWIILILTALLSISASAQGTAVYPVELTAMVTPPHSTCLKDYVGSRRFQIHALLRDMSKRCEDFCIEISVSKMGDKSPIFRSVIDNFSFTPGKPAILPNEASQNIIAQIFMEDHISIGREYATRCFPEGAYTISFQAFENISYRTSRRIALSRPSQVSLFMQANNAKVYLIYPYDKDVVCPNEASATGAAIPTGLVHYQWQPANPTGHQTRYRIEVAEIAEGQSPASALDGGQHVLDADNLFNSVYADPVTTTNYRAGKKYAWSVVAYDENTSSKRTSDSEIRTFVFCGEKETPVKEPDPIPVINEKEIDKRLDVLKLDSVSKGASPAIHWAEDDPSVRSKYCGVGIEIRKHGQEKWTAFKTETTEEFEMALSDINYNVHYDVRGQYIQCPDGANGDTVYAPYSDTLQFILPLVSSTSDCGNALPELANCNGQPGKVLHAGDTLMANGTPVMIDSISYSASDSSVISGTGHLTFPLIKFIQLKMEFKGITVNCAGELVKGEVKSVYDAYTSAMVDIEELSGEQSTGGKDNTVTNSTTNTYNQESFQSAHTGDYLIKQDGTVVMKDKDGKEVELGKKVTSGESGCTIKGSTENSSHYIEFFNDHPETNAFDKDENGYYRLIDEYPTYGAGYTIPWLANNPGKLKTLRAKEILKNNTLGRFEAVKFLLPIDEGYIELKYEKDGDDYILHIPGHSDTNHNSQVLAMGKKNGEEKFVDAGKLLVANYKERAKDLVIVPVGKKYTVSESAKKKINEIYGRLGITYRITVDEVFNNDTVNSLLADGLDISADDESRWQVESGEMKTLRYLYQKNHPNMNKKAAYIFLVEKAEAPYEGVEGDMPRDQSAGFIFMKNATELTDGRLVAHELGHGVYKFQHTFDYKQLKDKEGKTDNLMDYTQPAGDFLAHYQWKVMQDSVMLVWKVLQGDEDGLFYTAFRWMGDKLSGWAPDDLESKVEDMLPLFDHVAKNSTSNGRYWEVGRDPISVDLSGYQQWVVVKGKNLRQNFQTIHENKVVELQGSKENHIYVLNATTDLLGVPRYTNMSLYIFKDGPKISSYKINAIADLAGNRSVKAGYRTWNGSYCLIPFYASDGSLVAIIQVFSNSLGRENSAKSWTEYLLHDLSGNKSEDGTNEPLPEQPSGHYIVYKDDANEREDASKDYAVKNSIIIPQSTEVTVLEDAVTKKNVTVSKIKEVDSDQEHWTTKTNIKEIISLTETGATESMELEWSVFCRQLPYSNDTTTVRPARNLACTKIATCGDYFRIASPSLEEFGTSNNSKGYWIYDWQEIQTMSPDEIAIIRNQINEVTNIQTKGDYYLTLQGKSEYYNQRNNTSTATQVDIARNDWITRASQKIGDIMCNITSEAMAFAYLGIDKDDCTDSRCSNNCNQEQLEDYMECQIRSNANADFVRRTEPDTRKNVATLFGVSYSRIEKKDWNKKLNKRWSWTYDSYSPLLDSLRAGKGIILSAFGHIVRIQNITNEGLVVDDPYGEIVRWGASGVTGKYKTNNDEDHRNPIDSNTPQKGNDNLWVWSDLSSNNISFNLVEIYSK